MIIQFPADGQADARRREIEEAMYDRSLISDSRADILSPLAAGIVCFAASKLAV
jgi:hypothetical protein